MISAAALRYGTVRALRQGMKVVISSWQGRISPVFDVAGNLVILDVDGSREKHREALELKAGSPFDRATFLRQLGADLLICGMISHPQRMALASAGIRIVPHICGQVEDVVAAFLSGRLESNGLLMPGCGRRQPGRRRRYPSPASPDRPERWGRGCKRGRMGGTSKSASGGCCLCPDCGHKQPQKPGESCRRHECPHCGASMVRE